MLLDPKMKLCCRLTTRPNPRFGAKWLQTFGAIWIRFRVESNRIEEGGGSLLSAGQRIAEQEPGRMKLTGLLLLAFLPLTATRASTDSCAAWNPLSTRCPLAEDPAEAVSLALEKDVSGQHLAARSIHKALARNAKRYATGRGTLTDYTEGLAKGSVGSTFGVYLPSSFGSVLGVQASGDPATAPRPLFMHFSGPTGVGKSLSADIIAGAVLAGDALDENGLCGKLLLQMRAYASRVAKDIEAHTRVGSPHHFQLEHATDLQHSQLHRDCLSRIEEVMHRSATTVSHLAGSSVKWLRI